MVASGFPFGISPTSQAVEFERLVLKIPHHCGYVKILHQVWKRLFLAVLLYLVLSESVCLTGV